MTEVIRQEFSRQTSAAGQKRVSTLVALVIWSLCLLRALGTFGPDRDVNNVDFNSDAAIPVLMSNDDRPLTVFNLYYYAADRWGGWPFLVTRAVRHATGYHWTPERVFALQTLWIFVGVWVLASLSRRSRLLILLALLVAMCVNAEARYLIFELSQVYAWQTTAVLLGWLALRRVFDAWRENGQGSTISTRLIRSLFLFTLSFLAIWSSIASAPFLFLLLGVELFRASAASRATKNVHRRGGSPVTPAVIGGSIVAAAVLSERLMKTRYNQYSFAHYGDAFSTRFAIDTGHLADNLARQVQHVANLSWWPLYVLPPLALLVLAYALLHASLTRRADALAKLSATAADDTVVIAVGAYGIALLNLLFAVLVDHVRVHGYDDRYLTLTNLFAPTSGLLTVFLFLERLVHSAEVRAYATRMLLLLLLVWLALGFPKPVYSARYRLMQDAALAVARKAPGEILMGTYWDTYVFIALQRRNPMIPVPFEGVTRTPWTRGLVRHADRVIVAFTRESPRAPVTPPQSLRQHGAILSLAEPDWYGNQDYSFALYVNDAR